MLRQPDDVGPLLPRGDTVFEVLPVRALLLDQLAPAIGDGLIVTRTEGCLGVSLVRAGAIAETFALQHGRLRVGRDAADASATWDGATTSAWRLSADVLAAVRVLLAGTPCYRDLRLRWTSWDGLIDDLRQRRGTYVVTLDTPAGRGVTALRDGEHLTTYTDTQAGGGDAASLSRLLQAGTGSVTVLQEGGDADAPVPDTPAFAAVPDMPAFAAEPDATGLASPSGSAHAEVSTGDDAAALVSGIHDDAFARIFGLPLDLAGAAHPKADGELAALLPQLRQLVRDRLQLSAPRLESVLDAAAAGGASVAEAAAVVRSASIRGITQPTLDEIADTMLSLSGAGG